MLIAVFVGALLDLTLVPLGAHTAVVPPVIGVLVAMACGGGEAALLGGLWAWLMAQLADAVVSTMLNDPVQRVTRPFVAWVVAVTAGWLAGVFVNLCVERFTARHRSSTRIVRAVGVAVLSLATVILLYGIGRWGANYVITGTLRSLLFIGMLTTGAFLVLGLVSAWMIANRDAAWVSATTATLAMVLTVSIVVGLALLSIYMVCDAWRLRSWFTTDRAGKKSSGTWTDDLVVFAFPPVWAVLATIWTWFHEAIKGTLSSSEEDFGYHAGGVVVGVLVSALGVGSASYLARSDGWLRYLGLGAAVLAVLVAGAVGVALYMAPEMRRTMQNQRWW